METAKSHSQISQGAWRKQRLARQLEKKPRPKKPSFKEGSETSQAACSREEPSGLGKKKKKKKKTGSSQAAWKRFRPTQPSGKDIVQPVEPPAVCSS
jgi:hypothetical protein